MLPLVGHGLLADDRVGRRDRIGCVGVDLGDAERCLEAAGADDRDAVERDEMRRSDEHDDVEPAAADPGDPKAAGNLFSKPNGTYTYPTDSRYANNAADLVELRAKPLADATAFRVTLNTLKDPSLVAFSRYPSTADASASARPGYQLPATAARRMAAIGTL